jgi:hypothetical protein
LLPVLFREGGDGQHVGGGVGEQFGGGGEAFGELSTTRVCWAHTDSASGWAKIVRTNVATIVWAERGTRVSRLRMKWVRHRCHTAPGQR